MINRGQAMAMLGNPRTTDADLAAIAQAYPDLWARIASHPNAYLSLLDWLSANGDSSVVAAVKAAKSARGLTTASFAPPTGEPVALISDTPTTGMGVPNSVVVGSPGVPAMGGGGVVRPDTGLTYPSIPPAVVVPTPMVPTVATYPVPGMTYPMHPGYVGVAPRGKTGVAKAFDSITGSEGKPIIRFADLFRDTFKRHSRADMDFLMYSGTQAALQNRAWRLPWLYARVFAVLLSAFALLWLCMLIFQDTSGNVVPGVIFTGALIMPATIMIFFWEFDQARNVSFFDVVRIFFIGGAMSILLTFIVEAVTSMFQANTYGVIGELVAATFIGFTEEIAKAIVIFFLMRKLYGCLISNGLLVGAIVGTGFAVFETMGYGTRSWINSNMEEVLLTRGVLSIGGHVVWSAIAGAAIMLAQPKGAPQVGVKNLAWGRLIALFCVPVILHTVWDFFAFTIGSDLVYTFFAGLIAIAWVFIVRLINTGLRQYATLSGHQV